MRRLYGGPDNYGLAMLVERIFKEFGHGRLDLDRRPISEQLIHIDGRPQDCVAPLLCSSQVRQRAQLFPHVVAARLRHGQVYLDLGEVLPSHVGFCCYWQGILQISLRSSSWREESVCLCDTLT